MLYVGISDAPAWWVAQANTLAQLRGWSPFVGLQVEYSLMERTPERELMPMAQALNVGFTAWSPLAGGVLTGKYHGQGSSEQARLSSDMLKDFRPDQQRADRVVAAVKQVSDQVGPSRAGLASLPRGSGHTNSRRPQAQSIAGQSRQLRIDPFALADQSFG